jgi:hypothetical protein
MIVQTFALKGNKKCTAYVVHISHLLVRETEYDVDNVCNRFH